jgi:hypothetical protein
MSAPRTKRIRSLAFDAASQLNKSFSSLLTFAFVKLLFDDGFVEDHRGS